MGVVLHGPSLSPVFSLVGYTVIHRRRLLLSVLDPSSSSMVPPTNRVLLKSAAYRARSVELVVNVLNFLTGESVSIPVVLLSSRLKSYKFFRFLFSFRCFCAH